MAVSKLPPEKIYILYWQSVFNRFWRNNFVPEIDDLVKRYDLETVARLKNFEIQLINVNKLSLDFTRFQNLISRFKGRKLVGTPLVVIDEGSELINVDSSFKAKQLEKIFSEIKDYYLR